MPYWAFLFGEAGDKP